MSEFVDRMVLQRQILRVVNSQRWNENLFGLSLVAIARWQAANQIPPDAIELGLVTNASRALSFLGTKSQDQISNDYQRVSAEAQAAAIELEEHFRGIHARG